MATVAHNGSFGKWHGEARLRKSNSSVNIKPLENYMRREISTIEGTTGVMRDVLIKNLDKLYEGRDALAKVHHLLSNPPKSAHKEITEYRKLCRQLVEYQFYYQTLIETLGEEVDRVISGQSCRGGKRWSDDEDEILIDSASRDMPISRISIMLGRTPAAIQTRLSYLVGIKRVSAKVAGRFVGWFNGDQVEGDIDGVVTV